MNSVRWSAGTLLGRLPEPIRAELLELGVEVALPAGQRLLRQDECSDLVYVLLEGCVRICRLVDGHEPLLDLHVGGDLVGEVAVLFGQPGSATAITANRAVARVIVGARFRAFVHSRTELLLQIAGRIAERLRWAEERRGELATLDARARICRVLLAIADSHGRDVGSGRDLGVPLTQEDIASLTGVRLNTAEKTLRALSRAGLVRLGYRRIVVTDPARLREVARFDT
jgi:CRP/FNR family transcriptional regulator, cyclic AMP receptor protein